MQEEVPTFILDHTLRTKNLIVREIEASRIKSFDKKSFIDFTLKKMFLNKESQEIHCEYVLVLSY